MLIVKSVILGLIQGLTEFIPISSSAHLIIVPWLFGWTDPVLRSLTFDVSLHLGTLLALIVFFAADWVRLIGAWFKSIFQFRIGADPDRRLAWFILVACIPGAIAGVLLEGKIEALFHPEGAPLARNAMLAMAAIIALLAVLLLLADRLARHERPIGKMRWLDSVLIGLSQALAIFPGVSRSGSTITTGLALGLQREAAARFSFLLSAPIIAGAGAKSLLDLAQSVKAGTVTGTELTLFPIGFVAAAVSGFFCIKYLLRFLQKHTAAVFVYYRWALAVLVAVVALVRG